MAFHVGQRVQCIGVKGWRAKYGGDILPSAWPEKGVVYTVRAILSHSSWGDDVGLLLEEVLSAVDPRNGYEPSFNATRFRPLVETKTDISVFTSLLTPKPVPERV